MQQALSAGGRRPSTALAAASSTGGLGCFECLNFKRDAGHMLVHMLMVGYCIPCVFRTCVYSFYSFQCSQWIWFNWEGLSFTSQQVGCFCCCDWRLKTASDEQSCIRKDFVDGGALLAWTSAQRTGVGGRARQIQGCLILRESWACSSSLSYPRSLELTTLIRCESMKLLWDGKLFWSVYSSVRFCFADRNVQYLRPARWNSLLVFSQLTVE